MSTRHLYVVAMLFAISLSCSRLAAAESVTAPPELGNLVSRVLAENPRVEAARAGTDAASSRLRSANRPLYNPELEFDAETAESDVGSLGISQTLDWADKRGARTRVSAASREASLANLTRIRQQIAGTLLSRLANFHSAVSTRKLAERRVQLMQRFLNLAEKRRQAGDISQIELDIARLASTQAQLKKSQTAADQSVATQELIEVVGRRMDTWPTLPSQLPETGELNTGALLLMLPETKMQQARIASMRAAVTLRQRERRADPTIGIRGGQESSSGEKDPLIGLTLSIPLFVRNDFRAEVETATAELARIEHEGREQLRRAQARLVSAAQRYGFARQGWELWEQTGQPSMERQAELLERIWRAGELSTTDYLVQINQTLDTRAAALEARDRLWQSWFEWLVASARIEQWLGLNAQASTAPQK